MSKNIVIAVIMLAIGAGLGYVVAQRQGHEKTETVQSKGAATSEKKSEPLFYRNTMNPNVTSPVPAKDSMGMDYEPVYADEDQEETSEPVILFYRSPMDPSVTSPVPAKDAMGMEYVPVYAEAKGSSEKEPSGTVKIDPVMVQNIGVRTAVAEKTSLSRNIRAVGRVDYNEERMARLHPKIEGWVEELFIDKTGEQVEEDTILLSIYSPQLVATQQEYILALNNLEALENSKIKDVREGAENLLESALERLRLLDVPPHQIRELEKTRKIKKALHIHSPFAGIVTKIGARQGQYVTPKTELYMIADLSKVWVYADIYEYELPWVNIGDEVEMTLAALPGKSCRGYVSYIYPYAEAKTRTIKVRLLFDNPDLLLKPEMFADVTILAERQENVVVIPSEAIVRSGKTDQVFVVKSQGKFEPRQVTVGLESDGKVAILKGLREGETVVTSAQFLIDSESKLREATAKMMESLQQESGNRSQEADTGMQMPEDGD
jgi:Cu(I)/Ag(I) efflux system membrane fusion protein